MESAISCEALNYHLYRPGMAPVSLTASLTENSMLDCLHGLSAQLNSLWYPEQRKTSPKAMSESAIWADVLLKVSLWPPPVEVRVAM